MEKDDNNKTDDTNYKMEMIEIKETDLAKDNKLENRARDQFGNANRYDSTAEVCTHKRDSPWDQGGSVISGRILRRRE